MARRILVGALVIALAPLDLAFAQTGITAAPGTIVESIGREVAEQILVSDSAVAPRSFRLGTSSEATAPPAFQLMGRSFVTQR
jgi:hypothetical protein